MAGIIIEKEKAIYTYGQPMTALYLISDGKVRVDYPGGSYLLGKGDVIGICELCSEVHFLNYTVEETATIHTYPLSSVNAPNNLLQKAGDVARFFVLSACTQMNTLQNQLALSGSDCGSLYRSLLEDYEKYKGICERYRITPRSLAGIEELSAYLEEEPEEPWLSGYYLGLSHIYGGEHFRHFLQETNVSLGILQRGSLDFQRTCMKLEAQFHYRQQLSAFYFNETGNDLFDCVTSLYYKLDPNCEDKPGVLEDINRMAEQFENSTAISDTLVQNRMQQFSHNLALTAGSQERASTLPPELAGSLNTILEFAGKDLGVADSFRSHVHSYKLLPDRNSMDSDVCALRKVLTEEFYVLYTAVFEQTLHRTDIPVPVWMFLYFGYVDEKLAGVENAITLYHMVPNITDSSSFGVYTFYHWLMAIFEGKKEPSRNDLDQDYTDFMHKQKANGNVTERELMTLENNSMSKVNYELQNMFPSANKVTFGRISTFCPLFIEENALKDLEAAYVTVSRVAKASEQVRRVDYSAFYRSGLDMENIEITGKMQIHTECLPDVILFPNVGTRAVMWQEIEGKRRNTPARMCFSIFHMEDVNTSFLRMTAEFRWELCKRIQGGRWNDVSERSLTSEYFDYIQFYKKNHDLSAEAKERVHTGLLQAKNSFKEMFVRDYMQWILFEGNGSPRLNKVARRIFFTYCPFSADICAQLDQNPLYADLLSQHRIHIAQKRHQLDLLYQKLKNTGTPIPDTLEQERHFYEL